MTIIAVGTAVLVGVGAVLLLSGDVDEPAPVARSGAEATSPDSPGGPDAPERVERPNTEMAAPERPAEEKPAGEQAAATEETVKEPEAKPVAPAEQSADTPPAAAGEDTAKAAAPAIAPSFDIVRISDRDCTAVLAGRAAADARVRLVANGSTLATVQAGPSGEWAHVIDQPLEPGTIELSLEADGAKAGETLLLIVPDCANPGGGGSAVAVLTPENRTRTRMLQAPGSSEPVPMPQGLDIGKVDYDDEGNVEVEGSGTPEAEIRAYVDDKLVGRGRTDERGRWRVIPHDEIAPGLHVLRIDQVDKDGAVTARIELPFAREMPGSVALTNDRIVVQPGNSLWRIARRTYGRGLSYTTIFQANRDRIRNPDLIYPGQVFRLPPLPQASLN